MPRSKTIRHGGIMRCCVQTIAEDKGPDVEGRTLACKYESSVEPTVIYRDGAWEWIGLEQTPEESNDERGHD